MIKKGLIIQGEKVLFAAQGEGEATGPKKFSMLAYTGGVMNCGWGLPVIVDLAGMKVGDKPFPILRNHCTMEIVGHSVEAKIEGSSLMVSGVISGASEAAAEVEASALKGFPWQASIGASVNRAEELGDGVKATVNGKEITGPAIIARESELFEVSFVALGADGNTSVSIAAASRLFAEVEESAETEEVEETPEEDKTPENAETQEEPVEDEEPKADPVKAERERVSKILQAAGQKHTIEAEAAISSGLSFEDFQKQLLEKVRASRPSGFNINASGEKAMEQTKVLECALSLRAGASEKGLLKSHGEQVLEAAASKDYRGLGLRDMASIYAKENGHSGLAFGTDTIRAAMSTISLSSLLGGVVNRVLLESFESMAPESATDLIFESQDVSDFKATERIRMSSGILEEVANGNDLPAQDLSDDVYSGKARTFGGIVKLTMQDIINDDLGAFMGLPRRLARQAFLAREKRAMQLIEANANNFFHASNSNLQAGTFNLATLKAAIAKLRAQADSNGDSIGLAPAFLLVPAGLELDAKQLYESTNLIGTTEQGQNNPFRGLLRPVVSSQLKLTAPFYIVANPLDCAVGVVRYVKGVRTPQIEQGAMNLENLSITWACWFNFGVDLEDPRAAVKCTGA